VARTGFEDAEEPEDAGPEELSVWLAAGFGRQRAEVWRRWRFTLTQAEAWGREGIDEGLQAAQWRTAAATPDTVREWQAAGIDAAEAVRWHEFGFSLEEAIEHKKNGLNPDGAFAGQQQQAPIVNVVRPGPMMGGGGVRGWLGPSHGGPLARFHQSGVDPQTLHGYMQHHWVDEAAAEWARHGIEAQDAYVWFDLGLTASEAGRLTMQGRTPGDVVREWWTAGIPFEEMAQWIGAGLSASEALEQRANGITVEHAASLRALRVGEAAHPQGERLPPALLARLGPPRSQTAGPPPDDEEGARLAIKDAFAGMLTGDGNSNVAAVERGAGLGECLREAARRHGIPEGEPGDGATVTADFIRFVNDHEARVSFTVIVGQPRNMNFGGRIGRAVLVEGVWKVARETFCEFMQMAGVECPPAR
jgi:hypothetical protein